MTVLQILHAIVLGPLELLFDIVYALALGITHNPGISLIFMSLAINLLVLPLYRRADAMQEEEREQSLRLKSGVEHIRKVFKGDERFMILQTYYRQNNYKPYYALKGSLSLLLEIPFFIAAYHYLSNLKLLNGASFGSIDNLGVPDNLVTFGGISLHLLPILMTAINIVSGIIYTRGMPLKSKIQLYGMAIIFLVLLYESPSGLVFYWTLNNLFSLIKNIFYKIPNPKKVISIMCSVVGVEIAILGCIHFSGIRRKVLMLLLAAILQFPLMRKYIRLKDIPSKKENKIDEKGARAIFFSCCIFMSLLVGVLIPSAIISTSTSEFVDMADFHSPLQYILRTVSMAVGVFLLWCVIFYQLSSDKAKSVFSLCSVMIIFCAMVEYMFFGKGYGNISPLLKYDVPIEISAKEYALNTFALLSVAGGIYLLWKKGKGELLKATCVIGCLAITAMSFINIMKIRTEAIGLKQLAEQNEQGIPEFTLSKKGKNVIVIMMDRAISGFVPYLFAERPELKEQFAGFTYYPNALSFGLSTNVSVPSIYGGYEYVPFEINKRSNESLKDKHNEALKVMPILFRDNGYKVTVCDPPYANYEIIPDLSIFSEDKDINAYVTHGAFNDDESVRIEQKEKAINRNLFCYSLFRISPVIIHAEVYDGGNYNYADNFSKLDNEEEFDYNYISVDEFKSTGVFYDFISAYRALQNMSYMTKISDSTDNTFTSFSNTTTHDVMLLQEPEFEPKNEIDNSEYENNHVIRSATGAKDMKLSTVTQMEHYECNMAAFIQLGKWFDYLRDKGVWDNTRIIITADHGRRIGLQNIIMDDADKEVNKEYEDVMFFNPLFMIKDFGDKDFKTDDTFMTCADVPAEACKGLIDNPINPFTGKAINEDGKNANELYAMYSKWSITENHGNTFVDPVRITLRNHYMFDRKNWSYGD
ncbi:YidC/Oxa1 family membrane protein insertase [Ruminococcus sp.]|uniref:YidC/Oxa1 family membrane protein insertase n=1 Tax=Ruminococcus sp. TaxID=41978 RepID=UPI0025DEC53A|nr:YidC/Oxa1 family membrane protein insertase [Ruminococcus sp.]